MSRQFSADLMIMSRVTVRMCDDIGIVCSMTNKQTNDKRTHTNQYWVPGGGGWRRRGQTDPAHIVPGNAATPDPVLVLGREVTYHTVLPKCFTTEHFKTAHKKTPHRKTQTVISTAGGG